jgi:hypothetical protein
VIGCEGKCDKLEWVESEVVTMHVRMIEIHSALSHLLNEHRSSTISGLEGPTTKQRVVIELSKWGMWGQCVRSDAL